MTSETDQTGKLIRESKKGPLGFSANDSEVEVRQPLQVAIIERVIIGLGGLEVIAGGENAPMNIDDLRLILQADEKAQVRYALSKDRKRRKEKLKSRSGQPKP